LPYGYIIAVVSNGPLPELVGFAEVAELLGKSARQVVRLTTRPDFPVPVAKLRATPVWLKRDVERWAESAPLRRRTR
jgi:predicted DNA-binding transcriptional regulator AlpA